jgi:hypothetical protein
MTGVMPGRRAQQLGNLAQLSSARPRKTPEKQSELSPRRMARDLQSYGHELAARVPASSMRLVRELLPVRETSGRVHGGTKARETSVAKGLAA